MRFVHLPLNSVTGLDEPRPNINATMSDARNNSMIWVTPNTGRCHGDLLELDQTSQGITRSQGTAALRAAKLGRIDAGDPHVLYRRQQLTRTIDGDADRITIADADTLTDQRLP